MSGPEELRALVEEMRAGLQGVTPGPWSTFVADDGGQWTGWPLSINADSITDKTIVRTGGFYPYEWDAKTSQYEAVQNAKHLARCSPENIAKLLDAAESSLASPAGMEGAPLRRCSYCGAWQSKPCGSGCVWSPSDPTLEQLPAAPRGEAE